MTDPTARFSNRAEDYARYRPGYPPAAVNLLRRECGLRPEHVVADVGCGTGLLAKRFCEFGNRVLGVEPNAAMREAARLSLARFPQFTAVEGRAEATTLPAHSVDFAVVGQAFHWFDPLETRREFARILRSEGWTAIIWNDRRYGPSPFMVAYEALTRKFGRGYEEVKSLWDHKRLDEFFGTGYKLVEFDNQQQLNCAGMIGRMLSASYMPPREDPIFPQMVAEMERLFAEHQRDGVVTVEYDTRVFYGRVSAV